MHETGGNVNSEPKSRKPASSFKPAGYIIGKGNFFSRDPQNHLTWLYNHVAAVFNVNSPGYILKMGMIFYVIDL